MGYRSQVKIKMGVKAFELLKENCLKSKHEYIKEMVADKYIADSDETSVLMSWGSCKWYSYYEDVEAVENTLRQLNEIVEKDPDKLKDYFYKKIEIGEDNRTEEATNDDDGDFTDDFYVEFTFSL